MNSKVHNRLEDIDEDVKNKSIKARKIRKISIHRSEEEKFASGAK